MRALTISAHGGVEQLTLRDDLPIPPIVSPTDVRVRMQAAALNHVDLFVLGGIPGVTLAPPWIVGSDGAGMVDACGDEVTTVRPGDAVVINPGLSCGACAYCLAGDPPLCLHFRILGEHTPGTFAEFVVLPQTNLRVIPATVPMEVAAAFPLATLTAWRMLMTRARVLPAERVLIWGIGGGVSQAALQIAKLREAEVWVTSSSDEKLERARALGADVTLNHRTLDIGREVRARTGKRGVDIVVDNVGEATWKQSLGALAKRGRLVTCGGTSGPLVETDIRRLFWNQWTIMGSTMGSQLEFDAIVDELRAGRLVPPVDSVWPLAEGRQAYERLQSGEQFGKVVVVF